MIIRLWSETWRFEKKKHFWHLLDWSPSVVLCSVLLFETNRNKTLLWKFIKHFNMWVMSCTENESGPFVVFFLPAVVGCLTILLARRWANSQVSNTSSTAVSRRRKIIKDPLIKRPLPPLACKMMPPGSKKASGVNKKVTTKSSSTYPHALPLLC